MLSLTGQTTSSSLHLDLFNLFQCRRFTSLDIFASEFETGSRCVNQDGLLIRPAAVNKLEELVAFDKWCEILKDKELFLNDWNDLSPPNVSV